MGFIKKQIVRYILVPLVVILLLFILSTIFNVRIDLTKDKRYTLTDATKSLVKNIKEPVYIQVFLTGKLPSGFRQLKNSTALLLNDIKNNNKTDIQYEFISPNDKIKGTDITWADSLQSLGLYPINLTAQVDEGQQQQLVYASALVQQGNKVEPVALYEANTAFVNFASVTSAETLLEYKFAQAINKVVETKRPVVAYAVGNGEPTGSNTYDLVQRVLKPNYDLYTLNLKEVAAISPEISLLLLVKPTQQFTEMEKLKIDQYVMQGGRVACFIDRLNAEMDSLQIKNEVVAYDRDLNITDLFFNWGARINSNLLMDLQCDYLPFDVNGNGQYELLPWNYFPVFSPTSTHPIMKGIGFVNGKFVNTVDTVEAPNITKSVLLASSVHSRTLSAPALISGKENAVSPNDKKYNKSDLPVAVLLEGMFTSMYKNRLTPILLDSLKNAGVTYASQAQQKSNILIAGDGDLVLNDMQKGQPIPMGNNVYTYGTEKAVQFSNADFVSSALAYMLDEFGLNQAKEKEIIPRLLNNQEVKTNKSAIQLINIFLPVLFILVFALIYIYTKNKKYT